MAIFHLVRLHTSLRTHTCTRGERRTHSRSNKIQARIPRKTIADNKRFRLALGPWVPLYLQWTNINLIAACHRRRPQSSVPRAPRRALATADQSHGLLILSGRAPAAAGWKPQLPLHQDQGASGDAEEDVDQGGRPNARLQHQVLFCFALLRPLWHFIQG